MNEYTVSSTFNYTIKFTNGSTIQPYMNGSRATKKAKTNQGMINRLYDHDPYEDSYTRKKRIDDAMRYTV